ncbi:DsrE family protein [Salegentibacter sp. F14]
MKTILLSSFAMFLALFSTQVTAQEQPDHDHNKDYVVLTKKVDQLKPILLTAEALSEEDGDHFGEFQVIVCGKDISQLTNTSKMTPFVEQAQKLGVELVACGFSLNKFQVDRKEIPKEMTVVENGILHNLQLQKKGFYSLGL